MTIKSPPIVYAETVPYWKTSQSSADSWIDKCKREIASVGGKIKTELYGTDDFGKSAFMLTFEIAGQSYRLTWRVLPSQTGNDKAAKIQAATALYHDVKARVVSAKFMGLRGAFLPYLLLDNGQTAGDAAAPELLALLPQLAIGSGLK